QSQQRGASAKDLADLFALTHRLDLRGGPDPLRLRCRLSNRTQSLDLGGDLDGSGFGLGLRFIALRLGVPIPKQQFHSPTASGSGLNIVCTTTAGEAMGRRATATASDAHANLTGNSIARACTPADPRESQSPGGHSCLRVRPTERPNLLR